MNQTRPQDATINVYVTAQDSVSGSINEAKAKDGSGSKSEGDSCSKSEWKLGTDGSKKKVINTSDDMKIT